MKRTALFVALALLSALAFAQERISIAVFPFEDMAKVFTGDEAVLFYRRFSNEFVNKNNGRFRVIPRQDVEKLINTEAKFQLSDFSAKAKTAEMNRVLNGSQILSGYIGKYNGKISISICLFSYPDMEQLPGGVDIDVADKGELSAKIPDLVQSMMAAITGSGTANPPANRPAPNQTYKIGDFGPAGGIVFYDKGVFSNGWRYLEAAPVETEFQAPWGAYKQDLDGIGTAVGFGKRNTELIVERLKALGESGKAAQLCVSLNFDGYKDWFLPSKDELDLMFRNLKLKGLGSFSNNLYWSSSHDKYGYSWAQTFYVGDQDQVYNYNEFSMLSVRAVRAF